MPAKRIIPCLDVDDGRVVKGVRFQNLRDAGAKYLKQLLVKYAGDLALTLAAYNAGTARVDKAGDVPHIQETQIYVNAILDKLHSLQ